MALVADTQHAVELLQGMQNELQEKGDLELDQDLGDMIAMMESPLFTQLLTLQQSMRQLRDHVESTPPGQPIGEFDFTPGGELILQEPPQPEPEPEPEPSHPFAYENKIDLEDEVMVKTQAAAVEQSAPPSDMDEVDALLDSIAELAMGRDVHTIKLMKPENGGLGFSVVGLRSENHGELGIFVQQIQPSGVADKNGNLQESDQILAINGHLLDVSVSHQEAIVMLQKVKGLVELVVARGVFQIPVNAQANNSAPEQNETPADAVLEPFLIELYNDGSGLGFGIVGVQDVGIMVKTILAGGTADRDGRLQSGDIILQIGDTPLHGMTSDQVANVLRQAGSHVRLTVARRVLPDQQEPVPESQPTVIQQEPVIQAVQTLQEHSQPPPQYNEDGVQDLKIFEVVLEKGAEGLGITIAGYVRDLGTGQVSGIFIKKISEGSAAHRNGMVQVNDQIIEVDGQGLEGFNNVEAVDLLRNTGTTVHIKLARHPPGTLDISNMSMDQPDIASAPVLEALVESQEVDIEEEAPPVTPPSYPPPVGVLSVAQSETITPNAYEGELDPEVEASLVEAWQGILGPEVVIVVAQLSKFREGGGLGISLEGTVDIDEAGEEVRPHHYIRSILIDGPVGQNGRLLSGDELLEVNGERLLGLNHVDVVKTLKELPVHVRIVCARHPHPVFPEADTGGEAPQQPVAVPEASPEVPETMEAVEEVLTPQEVILEETVPFPEVLEASTVMSVMSVPTADRTSQMPRESISGLAVWDDQLLTVELVKGDRGLGFSILDYQDPLNPSKTVIVIRSLVSGGVAEQDGRLIPGDRLVFVNDCNLDDCSLEMAVQALKGAPQGNVVLKVAKPLPQLAEDTFDGPEPMIMPQQIASVHHAPPSGNQDVSAHIEELQELGEMQLAIEASQKPASPETVRRSPLVEEMVISAVASSNVESSIDFSQLMNDEPEAPPSEVETTPIEKETPPPATETTPVETETTPPATETTSIEAKTTPVTETTPIPAETTPIPADATPLETETTSSVAKTTPPDLVMAASVAPIPVQRTPPVTPTQVTAVKSAPPEPKRTPPAPPPKPPKPSPRTSIGTAAAASSQPTSPSEPTDSRVSMVVASHSPLGKRVSVVLPGILDKAIVLKKGNAGLGLTVNADKANGVVVKSIIRGGAVHHDGRLAVGDYITSVNGQPMRNLTNVEARALLRRASLVGDEISMTYIPASDASAYRDNPDTYSPKLTVAKTASTSPLRASEEPEDDKFALPLKDQPIDAVKQASVARSPVSLPSAAAGPEEIRTVRLTKEPNKSLGISIVGGRASDGQPVEGIYIKHVLDDSQAGRTGALKTGDRILEVNGCDLRDASHDYAVAIIRNAANPVCFIVQSLSAGDNMPTGVVSVIPSAEEDVVATATEKTETLPAEEKNKDEVGSKVNSDIMMAPLSPLKHKLSLSGSEDETDGTKDGNTTEINADFANLDGDVFTVQLTKSSLGLGISLAGNRDRSKRSVFVVGVDPGGAAGQDGRLQVADELLSINSVSVYGKSHQKASSVIKDIPREGDVQLVVRRHPQAIEQLAVTPLTPANTDKNKHFEFTQPDPKSTENEISSYQNVHTVTINKGNKGLGFAIHERKDMNGKFGIFIRDITKGGAADTEGSLRIGDHILSVDGNSLINTKKNEAILVLKGTDGKVSLTVSSEHPIIPPQPIPDQKMPEEVQPEVPIQEVVAASVIMEEQHAAPPPVLEGNATPVVMADDSSAATKEDARAGIKEEEGRSAEVERDACEGKTQEVTDMETGEKRIGGCQEREEQGVMEEKAKAIGEEEEKVAEAVSRDSEQKQEEVDIQPEVADTQQQEPVVEDSEAEKLEAPLDTQSTPVTTPEPETNPTPATVPDSAPAPSPESTVSPPSPEMTHVPVPTTDPGTADDPYTCPILPGVQTDIIIDKGKTGLGLSIVGGTDTQLSIVVVHEVYDHGAAARDNRLWPGDQLIQVNGIDLTNVRHEQAIAALRQSPTHVSLRVFRGHQQASQEDAEEDVIKEAEGEVVADAPREERPEEDEYDEMLSVELKHTRGRSLGLNIVGKTSGKGVVVSMVIRGSAAHAEGTLKAGDHILSINGKDVQEATREEVAGLLKATDGHVLFEIGRKKDLGKMSQTDESSHKQVRLVELKKIAGESLGLSIAGGKGSEMGDIPLIIASINPGSQADKNNQLKVLDCIESINGQGVTGLSYANAINLLKSSQGVIRLEVSELSPKIKEWYLSSQKSSGKGDAMVAVKASVKQPPAGGTGEEASAGRLKNIVLQRGPDGLGFSIVGGHGSPHGDLPIYIKTVFNKGAASVSGELKRGDQIMAVNAISLEAATHEQAVDILKQAKGRVVITILA